MNDWRLEAAVRVLRGGGIIAYPTEAVYGLGCDPLNPVAVERLVGLKQRQASKGLILIAADFDQLSPFLAALPPERAGAARATWPGPVTWLWPARAGVAEWLRGAHETLAVRVTSHPLAAALCRRFNRPLVSTSANLSGRPPARTPLAVRRAFGKRIDYVLHGPLGGLARPTEIRDALSGRVLRAG